MASDLVAVTYERHGGSSFRRFSSFEFARKEGAIPIVLAEAEKIAAAYPIAFIKTEKFTLPVAVMALDGADNLFITADGKWFGPYVPAVLRGYPFRLAHDPAGQTILCYDQSSGLIKEGGGGEALFTEDGKPAARLQEVIHFLQQLHANRQKTHLACVHFERFNLLDPLQLEDKSGKAHHLQGLLQINAARLKALPDDDFLTLRKSDALSLIYAHLISFGHWPTILRLREMQAQAKTKQSAPPASLDSIFGVGQQDELNIDWSKIG